MSKQRLTSLFPLRQPNFFQQISVMEDHQHNDLPTLRRSENISVVSITKTLSQNVVQKHSVTKNFPNLCIDIYLLTLKNKYVERSVCYLIIFSDSIAT